MLHASKLCHSDQKPKHFSLLKTPKTTLENQKHVSSQRFQRGLPVGL